MIGSLMIETKFGCIREGKERDNAYLQYYLKDFDFDAQIVELCSTICIVFNKYFWILDVECDVAKSY